MQESKTMRDERLNKESQDVVKEGNQKAMRTDGSQLLKVEIQADQAVVVRVSHQGQPHPKGYTAAIHHTVGPMTLSVAMFDRVKDAAINYMRGQAHEFSISEVEEQEEAKDAETPAGATKENPNPSDAAGEGVVTAS